MAKKLVQMEFPFAAELKKEIKRSNQANSLWEHNLMESIEPKAVKELKEINEKAANCLASRKKRSPDLKLIRGIKSGNHSMVLRALAEGANANGSDRWGKPAILHAIQKEDAWAVDLLLSMGADPNTRSYYSSHSTTPLIEATRTGNMDIFRKILEAAEKRGLESKMRDKALMHAICYKQNKMAAELLGRGVSVDATDERGMTALMYAAMAKNYEGAKMLIERGADVNATSEGRNALFFAAEAGDIDIVRLLAEKGADPFVKDFNGQTPKKVAKTEEIKKFLKDYEKQVKGSLLERAFEMFKSKE
ncbi:MAG: ankyrin repeat domain-containing protein [Candidatus Anstonellales archaeon]